MNIDPVDKEAQNKIDAKEEKKKVAHKVAGETKKEQDKRKGTIDYLVGSIAKEFWKVASDLLLKICTVLD